MEAQITADLIQNGVRALAALRDEQLAEKGILRISSTSYIRRDAVIDFHADATNDELTLNTVGGNSARVFPDYAGRVLASLLQG